MGDPRRPAMVLAVEDDLDWIFVRDDGQVHRAANITMSEEDVDRIRTGYVCMNCMESTVSNKPCRRCKKATGKEVRHGSPFPEHCPVCGFEMRDKQPEKFAKQFQGTKRIGPSTTLEDEEAAMLEWEREQIAQQRDSILRPTQILLPGKDF